MPRSTRISPENPEDRFAELASLARPAAHLRETNNPVFSRIGGLPLIERGFVWPMCGSVPLEFVAQLDLAEIAACLPESMLPATGRLYFFYDSSSEPWGHDPRHRDGWKVAFREAASAGLAIAPFPTVPTKLVRYAPQAVAPHPVLVWPDRDSNAVDSFGPTETERDSYRERRDSAFVSLPRHQVLGLPSLEQGDCMEEDCQLVSNGIDLSDPDKRDSSQAKALMSGASEWKLLLQIDQDLDRLME